MALHGWPKNPSVSCFQRHSRPYLQFSHRNLQCLLCDQSSSNDQMFLTFNWSTLFCWIHRHVLDVFGCQPVEKRLVFALAHKGVEVEFDFENVQLAGCWCFLALGTGLGAFLVYRFSCRWGLPLLNSSRDGHKLKRNYPSCDPCDKSSLVAPKNNDTDDGVDGVMGTNSSKPAPRVYYSAQHGVALCHQGPGQTQSRPASVDCQPVARFKSRPDSGDGRCTVSTGYGMECSAKEKIRESFHSTTESGFETLPESNDTEQASDVDGSCELTQSMIENCSMSSLVERNDQYFSFEPADNTSSCSSGHRTELSSTAVGCDVSSRCPPASNAFDPSDQSLSIVHASHRLGVPDCDPTAARRTRPDPCRPTGAVCEGEHALDESESTNSVLCDIEACGGVDCREPCDYSLSDDQFRWSLRQRIQEWTTFAANYRGSDLSSPTDSGTDATPAVDRRRSPDRHACDLTPSPDCVDLSSPGTYVQDESTVSNLECLEGQFHAIHGEFGYITSRLHELIAQCAGMPSPVGSGAGWECVAANHRRHGDWRRSPSSYSIFAASPVRCAAFCTRWERMPRRALSDSSVTSCPNSAELAWDCSDIVIDGSDHGSVRLGGTLDDAGDSGPAQDGWLTSTDGVASPGMECNVGEVIHIIDYVERNCASGTAVSEALKQGYCAIPKRFHCRHLRQVRADGYGALRCVLFQVLADGIRVSDRWPGLIAVVDCIHLLYNDTGSGLELWDFARRLLWSDRRDKLDRVTHCVLLLYATVEEMRSIPSKEERTDRICIIFNGQPCFDVQLMEGLKLMMLLSAWNLTEHSNTESCSPPFVQSLFQDDPSSRVASFVRHRLNLIGRCSNPTQEELSLLAYCLGIKLRVAYLLSYEKDRFEQTLPVGCSDHWPSVFLLAEDDGHFNVPLP